MHTMTFMTNSFWNLQNNKPGNTRKGAPSLILTLSVLLTAALLSCSQDPGKIGIGLLPDSDFVEIGSTDTIGIRAYTMYDELSVSNDSTVMIIGSIHDEYFGDTYCDFVTQLRLLDKWPARPYVIDSVMLAIFPSIVSGDDSTSIHRIRLCETGTRLADGDEYYSGQDPDTIRFLGEYDLPRMKAGELLRVKLDNSVGEYLLRDTTKLSAGVPFYEDYFKGLYCMMKSSPNSVMVEMDASKDLKINPLGITIYYKSDTLRYTFSFVATHRAVNYNRFTHDRTKGDPDKQILHVNDFVADTAVYLQSYNGVYVKLDMPALEAFRDVANLAVNKARIIAPVILDGKTMVDNSMPQRVYVRYRDADGKTWYIPDFMHSILFMDGTYYSDKDHYLFNITTFVQKYLNGEIEEPSVELFLPLAGSRNAIFRANEKKPSFKLEFAYTIY